MNDDRRTLDHAEHAMKTQGQIGWMLVDSSLKSVKNIILLIVLHVFMFVTVKKRYYGYVKINWSVPI